jgi:hypothetical protein
MYRSYAPKRKQSRWHDDDYDDDNDDDDDDKSLFI